MATPNQLYKFENVPETVVSPLLCDTELSKEHIEYQLQKRYFLIGKIIYATTVSLGTLSSAEESLPQSGTHD